VPRLLATLDALGLPRSAVDYVIPSHVHLDHAGGAGALMRELPAARMLVHPRGLKHLLDPGALYDGALAVYGPETMARDYGELLPVDAARAAATEDGQTVLLGQRTLEFAHTPGHALHHHCLWDERSRSWFTGDTFGLSYREFDTAQGPWIVPTATPVQFEPEVLDATVRRLLAREPQCMYVTHYGCVRDVPRLGALLLEQLAAIAALGHRERLHPSRHEALKTGQLDLFCASLAAHGCTLPRARVAELMAIDLELNAQGMAIWLDKQAAPSST
jgi:glyoxylase-like metal-dependent hydrolase (beta-lactamase superfamily II)